jgi:peptide/nickel transport system permease protein
MQASFFNYWQRCWSWVYGNTLILSGLTIIGAIILLMLFAPWLVPQDPRAINLHVRLLPPSSMHWFGTDEVGRDLFSRVLTGSQQSVGSALAVVLLAGSTGTLLGCCSGSMGGIIDTLIMRCMDIMLSLPMLVVAMAVAAVLGPGLLHTVLVVAVLRAPFYVRLARGQTMILRHQTYIEAARTCGASRWHLISWHLLPGIMPPLMVQASQDTGTVILIIATLSFIGLGAQQPAAEWGAMVAGSRNYMMDSWWYPAFPGMAIFVTTIGFNLLSDGLADRLNRRQGGANR